MIKRWIVNAAERTVTMPEGPAFLQKLAPDEFFWDGTYADAMSAGARRLLAEEALLRVRLDVKDFVIVADRIEAQESHFATAASAAYNLSVALVGLGFDVWREGTGLVVLGRLP